MTAEPTYYLAPKPGDIVWCRFPQARGLNPTPKSRPALVVRVGVIADKPAVEVAYGTSQRTEELFPGEFAIRPDDGDAFRVARLASATKFNLARTVELPYNDRWFAVAPGAPHGQTPKLGVLHPSLVARAQSAKDQIP